ncbi:SDR family oxidoreductase [Deinococcus malanensis]|uniref:SDR family oxidoreductase n=1 Tax=Deinococcus malanensis TaxID=1706855 RepID=UPI00363FF259
MLVTGGSGQLGRRVIGELLEQGRAVQAISRRPGPQAAGLTWVTGDLNSAATLQRGLDGVSRVVHLATQPLRPGKDLQMTSALLGAVQDRHIEHFVYMSISGLERMQGAPYYREKLEIERRLRTSGLRLTIQRSTQFHKFVADLLGKLTLGPVTLVPTGVTLQPVEVSAVARCLAQVVQGAPAGQRRDLSGPAPEAIELLARQWHRHRARTGRVASAPIPLPLFRAWQHSAAVPEEAEPVGRPWIRWLQETA